MNSGWSLLQTHLFWGMFWTPCPYFVCLQASICPHKRARTKMAHAHNHIAITGNTLMAHSAKSLTILQVHVPFVWAEFYVPSMCTSLYHNFDPNPYWKVLHKGWYWNMHKHNCKTAELGMDSSGHADSLLMEWTSSRAGVLPSHESIDQRHQDDSRCAHGFEQPFSKNWTKETSTGTPNNLFGMFALKKPWVSYRFPLKSIEIHASFAGCETEARHSCDCVWSWPAGMVRNI
jgi:hypothetical protein